jgi:hypothetical protein
MGVQMKHATIQISDRLLLGALHLPEDARVLGARFNADRHCIELELAHDTLPDVGAEPPMITPIFQSHYFADVLEPKRTVEMIAWDRWAGEAA